MQEFIKKYSKNTLLISILLLILSIFFMLKPLSSIYILVRLFAGIVVIDGIIHIISYFKTPQEIKIFSFEFLEGLIEIIGGGLTLFFPEWISAIFPIVIGLWIMLSSVIKFQLSLNLKYVEGSRWLMLLILSIITAILGFIIILNPMISTAAITAICGVILFTSELINIIEYIFILIKLK
ncbi:MAG: DUF308 domain-containing protein [Clostridia bacterium]|nr:DUF308 domain-containing protein [Clostridia bacterium]